MTKIDYQNFPPNYRDIRLTFDIGNRPDVVFTYGDTVFVPSGKELSPDLIVHEEVHIKQQSKMGAEAWWTKYLVDADFRLSQEIESYRAQYKYAIKEYSRPHRRGLLRAISKDLAGPIYGNLMDEEEAKKLITEEENGK